MIVTTHDQVRTHRQSGSWRTLEQNALAIIADVQKHAGGVFQPKLGGGTRLMLALDHRISHDIDLFIRDPQWIGYITPRLNDRVEAMVADYEATWTVATPRDRAGLILASPSGNIYSHERRSCSHT